MLSSRWRQQLLLVAAALSSAPHASAFVPSALSSRALSTQHSALRGERMRPLLRLEAERKPALSSLRLHRPEPQAAPLLLQMSTPPWKRMKEGAPKFNFSNQMQRMKEGAEKAEFGKRLERMKGLSLAVILLISAFFASPSAALAARTGGRVGGSFRAAPQSRAAPQRSYSAPRPSAPRSIGGRTAVAPRGRTAVAPRPPVVLAPAPVITPFRSFSPWGWSPLNPFGFSPFSPFGFSPFGFGARPVYLGPSLSDLIVVGALAYGVWKVSGALSNGSSGFNPSLSPALAVTKLQVAVNCETRDRASLLGTIKTLAKRCDTEDDDSVASLVSDVALALLRKESDWISASLQTAKAKNLEDGESKFSEFSLRERAKIDCETFNKVGGRDRSEKSPSPTSGAPQGTVAVVTLIVAQERSSFGGSEKAKDVIRDLTTDVTKDVITDVRSLREALLALATDALSADRKGRVVAAEVLWTPEADDDLLSPLQVTMEYPDLMPL